MNTSYVDNLDYFKSQGIIYIYQGENPTGKGKYTEKKVDQPLR